VEPSDELWLGWFARHLEADACEVEEVESLPKPLEVELLLLALMWFIRKNCYFLI